MRSSRRQQPVEPIERREPTMERPALELRTSTKRRKTATAWWEGPRLILALPAHVRGNEREDLVSWLVERALRHRPSHATSDAQLMVRSKELIERYDLGVEPASVRFVTNQQRRWGSCTPETGAIRLSDRLRSVPDWVLDAVLVHELAHLTHHGHGQDFRALADRHPRQAEATLFLEGFQLGLDYGGSVGEDVEACAEAQDEEVGPARGSTAGGLSAAPAPLSVPSEPPTLF